MAQRNANVELVLDTLRAVTAKAAAMTTGAAIAAMEAEGVPCAPANELADMPDHPQMQANETFTRIAHPQAGTLVEPKNPPNFTGTPSSDPRPAAALGQHTDEILADIGIGPEALAGLREAGVIA